MKYTITINQKAIIELGLQDKLDFIDIAIFDFITDFMLCEDCHKIHVCGSRYFWIKADVVIENLPLLGITTTRGVNKRIDKLIDCGLLERCPDNQTLHQSFYKVGVNYKNYKFFAWNENSKQGTEVHAWNESSDYNINNNNISSKDLSIEFIDDNNNKANIEKEKNTKKEKENAELFEQCWIAYNRKGSKKKAKDQWHKLTDKEKERVLQHIKVYVATREKNFQRDFERYLRDKVFNDLIIQNNTVIYDPIDLTNNSYHPITGGALNWNEYYKCYLYTSWYFDGDSIADGYDDDKRPDGAQIVLNNGRGTLTWSKKQQKWIKS